MRVTSGPGALTACRSTPTGPRRALYPSRAEEQVISPVDYVFVACAIPGEGESVADLMGTSLQGNNDAEMGWPADPATTDRREMYRLMWCNDMDADTADRVLDENVQDNRSRAVSETKVSRAGFAGLKPMTWVLTLRDAVVTPLRQRRFTERLGGGLEVVEIHSGHDPMITRPDELARALLRYAAP